MPMYQPCVICGRPLYSEWSYRIHMETHEAQHEREQALVAPHGWTTTELDEEYKGFLMSVVEKSPEFQEHYVG